MWRANYSQSLCYWRRFDFNNDLIYSCKSLLVLKQKSLLLKPSLPCVKIQHNYDVWGVAIINFQMHPCSLNQIQTIFSILRSHSSYSQHVFLVSTSPCVAFERSKVINVLHLLPHCDLFGCSHEKLPGVGRYGMRLIH